MVNLREQLTMVPQFLQNTVRIRAFHATLHTPIVPLTVAAIILTIRNTALQTFHTQEF